ncbi:hypothetical protein BY996DRAFT_7143840, partial [Phakopsora pachyrhizi]
MGKKLPSLVAKRAAYIENWGMVRLWSYSIHYCPFLIDLWLNPFVMSALCLFVVLSNLPICGFMHLALIFHV